ncbi:N-acetylmuramoyl-L-alanine amidase [Granulicatella elegans]|uniref:N-acetylmuramoyl-L-alanine amidase n=1 Tax=Granulicatella elegans TaxID=137732 RepID=UPI001D152409|nr:N-acetylmuramoyl-L-alanine amidase [Granulicatella elegans]UEA31501.1 N-acetylmuramoyl-L-alanine amidase [Granulicatella elegans]
MVEKINETLMENSGRLVGVEFVVIHNDAGSMTPVQYIEWLRYREKSLGIAHYYCNRNTIVRVVDTYHIAYHTGDWWSNIRSIGYEVCESMKVSDEEFLENEDITLMQATEDLLYYGLPITTDTVRLHHEFVPTSCPHRSLALHGGTTESVKEYFVFRMNELAQLGSTVEEMLETISEQKGSTEAVDENFQKTVPSADEGDTELTNNDAITTNESLAKEVILGLWGNGAERKHLLEEAGYDYDAIQEIVNQTLNE